MGPPWHTGSVTCQYEPELKLALLVFLSVCIFSIFVVSFLVLLGGLSPAGQKCVNEP